MSDSCQPYFCFDLLFLIPLQQKTSFRKVYDDSPGVRYGKNIAYVIDIHTRRASSGGSLGFNLTNALTTKLGSNDVYASVNRGKSQLNILYEQTYVNNKASEYNEDAQYLLHDGSEYQISRKS